MKARQSPGELVARLAVTFLGTQLNPEGLAQLAAQLDRDAKFTGSSVTVNGLRALDWIHAAIERNPEWIAGDRWPQLPKRAQIQPDRSARRSRPVNMRIAA